MPHVLAIEAVPARARRLRALVRQYVHAKLTIVASVPAAIDALATLTPDVVIVPTLLAPDDEGALMARIRELPQGHVQTLTIPWLEFDDDVRPPAGRRFLRRRRQDAAVRFDPTLAAARITAGLERARAVRDEQEHTRALGLQTASLVPARLSLVSSAPPEPAPAVPPDERRRAPRIVPGELPWLSGVRTPWGLDLTLINISSTGLLVESSSKLSPGVTYEIQLQGPETALLVKAQVVRSDIHRVDTRGVRYCAAASFDRTLEVIGRREARRGLEPGEALAELLRQAISGDGGISGEAAEIRFARGLCRLLGARDVLVRPSPVTPADGSESIYFQVAGHGRSGRVLQVLFDPHHPLTEGEFRLLQAAAPIASAVLALDRPAGAATPLAIPA